MELQISFAVGGQRIYGMLHLPSAAPAPGVALCHGFTGNRIESHRLFVKAARDFAAHGLAALRFDFRGSGESEGDFREMTVAREIEDALGALHFLASRREVDPGRLGLLGLSMGGCVSACVAGRSRQVKALVLWAAAAHPKRALEAHFPGFALPETEFVDYGANPVGRAFLEDLRTVEPLEEVEKFRGPALIVHGDQDLAVPVSDAEDFRQALGGWPEASSGSPREPPGEPAQREQQVSHLRLPVAENLSPGADAVGIPFRLPRQASPPEAGKPYHSIRRTIKPSCSPRGLSRN